MFQKLFGMFRRSVRRLVPYNSFLFKFIAQIYFNLTVSERLKKRTAGEFGLAVYVVDHCNLNCKGCVAFSPIIEESFYDEQAFENDCARLSELTGGKLSSLQIMGGEPLLHPQIINLMKAARKQLPNTTIQIVSNGLLLTKQGEEFWNCCNQHNIQISLTKYPIKLDFDKIKGLADGHNVPLLYQNDTDVREMSMTYIPLDKDGNNDIKQNYKLCFQANTCYIMSRGKIYTCHTIAHIEYFNRYFNQDFIVGENDYIDIYKAETIDEVLSFLCKPMPFCRYCNTKKMIFGVKWGISKKEMSEWALNGH
jgi:MoaA/NifB/PqqE/SkfB family radical SAM enzyme